MSHFAIPVSEFMSSPVIGVTVGTTLADAAATLAEHQISAVPVTNDAGEIAGIISRKDILRSGDYDEGGRLELPNETVGAHMTSPAITVRASDLLSAAARRMSKERIHRVFVTAEDGALAGVLSTRDLMRAVQEARINTPLSEISNGGVVRVKASDSIETAIERLDASNKAGLVVVDGEWPVGIFDESVALASRALDAAAPVEVAMNYAVLVLPQQLGLARAAGQALSMNVRRILTEDDRGDRRIVSGLDFAKLIAAAA